MIVKSAPTVAVELLAVKVASAKRSNSEDLPTPPGPQTAKVVTSRLSSISRKRAISPSRLTNSASRRSMWVLKTRSPDFALQGLPSLLARILGLAVGRYQWARGFRAGSVQRDTGDVADS